MLKKYLNIAHVMKYNTTMVTLRQKNRGLFRSKNKEMRDDLDRVVAREDCGSRSHDGQ